MLVIKARILPGDTIESAAEGAIILANRLGVWVEFKFNGALLSVCETSTVTNIVEEYHRSLQYQGR